MRWLIATALAVGTSGWLANDASPPSPGDRPVSVSFGFDEPLCLAAADTRAEEAKPGPPTSQPYGARRQHDWRGRGGRPGSWGMPRQGPGFHGPGGPPGGHLGGPPGNRPGGGAGGKPLTPDEIDKLMAFTRENFPEVHDRLSRLRQRNAEAFGHMAGRVHEMFRPAMDDPEMLERLKLGFRVERKLAELRRAYEAAETDEQRADIQTQMREQLSTRFDLRLDRLRLEIRELENRLERTRQDLAKHEQDKPGIIDDELAHLLEQPPRDPSFGPRRRMHKRDPGPPASR